MSGSFSVPFAAAAVYLDNKYAQGVFAALAFSAVWFAAYRVWRFEREKLLNLEGLISGVSESEKILSQLVELQKKGMQIYNETNYASDAYIANLVR